jgi:cobalt-zinc-cadmium efflux system outer membrane protein
LKYITASFLLLSALNAQSFEKFLDYALIHSPYLQASKLQISQAMLEGKIHTRYENPTLEVEYATFNPTGADLNGGHRIALSQPLRLWGVGDNKKRYAKALTHYAQINNQLEIKQFKRDISLRYLNYVKHEQLLQLRQEEQTIAQKIATLTQARYDGGNIAKGKLLQAKIDLGLTKSRLLKEQIAFDTAHANLLKSAGFNTIIAVDTTHKFHLKITKASSPQQLYYRSQADVARKKNLLNQHTISSIELFGEYEKEPDQRVSRVGVAVPLAFFSTRSQEAQIEQLESSKMQLLETFQSNQDQIDLTFLTKKLSQQKSLIKILESILDSQQKLLLIHQEGYEVSNSGLLELQNVKNRLILIHQELINARYAHQANIIMQNYLAGDSHE